MATPQLLTKRDFTTSRYGELAEQSDVSLLDVIVAAEHAIQQRVGRKFAATSYTETYTAKSNTLFVVNRPLIAVTSLNRRWSPYAGWTPVTQFRSHIGPDYIEVFDTVKGFDVQLVYTAGFVEIPYDIKQAVILQTALFLQQDIEFYGAGDGKEPGIMYAHKDIDRILEPYCLKHSTVYR